MEQSDIITQAVGEIVEEIQEMGPEQSAMVHGSPGIGKTEAIYTGFQDYIINQVLAGCSEPTDISGVPFPFMYRSVNVATDILPPLWAWQASINAPDEYQGNTVIFLDDLPSGPPETQAACFKLFGERRVGNLLLRDNVHVVGAGNRTQDKSGANFMPLALGNRMRHYYAATDTTAWLAWATEAHVHPNIIAYIRRRPETLDQFQKHIDSGSNDPVFPTPRSWTELSRSISKKKQKEVTASWLMVAAQGCIGIGAAQPFTAFATTVTELTPPEEIVDNPSTAKIPNGVDVMYATICSLEYYINQPANYHHWINAVRYILREEMEPEYGVLIAKSAVTIAFNKLGDEGRSAAIMTDEFCRMSDRYGIFLDDREDDTVGDKT